MVVRVVALGHDRGGLVSLLSAGEHIRARLRTLLPTTVHVLAAPDIDDIAAGRITTPCVYVIYAGGEVAEARADGRAARLRQRWMVISCVRHAARVESGAPAREEAGTIADLVLAALMGWAPDECTPLLIHETPSPGYVAGLQWVPITFSTSLHRRADT